MSQQPKLSAPTSLQVGSVRSAPKSLGRFRFGIFVVLTTLAVHLAAPAPLRVAFADMLSGFLSGPTEVWHGETVALTLAPALHTR